MTKTTLFKPLLTAGSAFIAACSFISGLSGCVSRPIESSGVAAHVIRLSPGSDVRSALTDFAKTRSIRAGSIVSAVGSLTSTNLRYANQKEGTKQTGHFEVVSLSGTLAVSGLHVHASVANEKGAASGGHLLEGNIVYTTLEIVILEYKDLKFSRVVDPTYGYEELHVER